MCLGFNRTVKGCRIPSVGTKVLVEATFNANAAYKWNTQRVQLLPETNAGSDSADDLDHMHRFIIH